MNGLILVYLVAIVVESVGGVTGVFATFPLVIFLSFYVCYLFILMRKGVFTKVKIFQTLLKKQICLEITLNNVQEGA